MRTVLISLLFAAAAYAQGTPAPRNACVSCHLEAGDDLARPVQDIKNDVHDRRGLSCVNCHGGDATSDDMEKAMDPRRGWVGRPAPKQVAGFCGKCHSNAEVMKTFNPSLRVDQET